MSTAIGEGLFTQEQHDYVNSVGDADLRAHLLHQVRLRDNMERDRDAFEKQAAEWPSVAKAVERITSAMLEDKSEGSYYYSWQANIAMAFQDEWNRHDENKYCKSEHLHMVANNAAKNFLDLLCAKPMTEKPVIGPEIKVENEHYNQGIEDALEAIQFYNTGKELSPLFNQLIPKIEALKKL